MSKKTKSPTRKNKNKPSIKPVLFMPAIALAVVLAAVGGYWLAGNVFGGKSTSSENTNRAAFAPPVESKNTFNASRPNPFAPWKTYEEKLPGDVYEPSHNSASGSVASLNMGAGTENPNWIKNSVPFSSIGSGPLIAIVIDDMGVDRGRSKK
ncbi:MAG: hypothetical protein OEL50_02425, partial [Rhodospirillaceae bacterium]|nr:hypothetical protein [Rhodospirillaceae bacterium]